MSRRVLVTGCSSGIGYAVAQDLLDDGQEVLGISRSRPPLHDQRFHWVQADVSSKEAMLSLQQRLEGLTLDALVHCAAIRGAIGPVDRTDPMAWLETIGTNLIGTYNVVQATLPHLRSSDDARLLLFAGGGAFEPRANFSAYSCAKAAVVRLAETLAIELHGTTVAVNCIAPGFIPTPIHQATLRAGPELAGAEYQQVLDGMATADKSRLRRAVTCVHHLLSTATYGLSGRTIAAQFDAWERIGPQTIPEIMRTDLWTSRRVNAVEWERTYRGGDEV